MTNKEKYALTIPLDLGGRESARLINKKFKEGWVMKDYVSCDEANNLFTYYFE